MINMETFTIEQLIWAFKLQKFLEAQFPNSYKEVLL